MESFCGVCMKPGGDCPACLKALFGARSVPAINVEVAKLHTLALSVVGKASLSGVQRKISVGFGEDRKTLQVEVEGARFILKPQTETYPQLPENEHLTMRLGALFGLEIPPCGLFPLVDGSLAYIIRRFDRLDDGGKLRAEDFCQLAELPSKDKYSSSAEQCFKLINRFADEPLVECLKLFRQLVFSWWVGNGDLHLKNLAMMTDEQGTTRLSPAYDLVSTHLVIPDDDLALPVSGKRSRLNRAAWLRVSENAGIPERAADRVLAQPARVLPRALELVSASTLRPEFSDAYAALLTSRAGDASGIAPGRDEGRDLAE